MEKIIIHPGEILKCEFLEPLEITDYALAKAIGVQQTRISMIVKGERSITVDTALRLGRFFNTSPEFWMNLQNRYDRLTLEEQYGEEFNRIRPCSLVLAA